MSLPYSVTSDLADGDKSTARFLRADTAYRWAVRLSQEQIRWTATKNADGVAREMTLAELKKESEACRTSSKKTAGSSTTRLS